MRTFNVPEQSGEEFIRQHEGEPMTPALEEELRRHHRDNPRPIVAHENLERLEALETDRNDASEHTHPVPGNV